MCRPSAWARPAALLGVALALGLTACGKSDLRRASRTATGLATVPLPSAPGGSTPGAPAPSAPPGSVPGRGASPSHSKPRPAISQTGVAAPLRLSASRAASFARTVQLTVSDLVGARQQARSSTPRIDEREAAKCATGSAATVGGGRSRDYVRGRGLDREDFSSSVVVLGSESAVRDDLAYAQSKRGVRCFSRIIGKSAGAEAGEHVRLLGVEVLPVTVDVPGGQRAAGLRIAARVGVPGTRAEVSLYSDALSLGYGPTELDLYATSFVQPAPLRTEQQLLTLMRERARLARL